MIIIGRSGLYGFIGYASPLKDYLDDLLPSLRALDNSAKMTGPFRRKPKGGGVILLWFSCSSVFGGLAPVVVNLFFPSGVRGDSNPCP